MSDISQKPAVLFDGACPLCAKEIAFYRRLRGAERLDWIDISTQNAATVCGVAMRDARARFHVVMPDGKAISGAEAFVAVWRRMPIFRVPAILFGNAPGLWLMNRGYDLFLRVRPRLQRLLAKP
jgi:predicted DCC family thiol-disulfide oxidoreductase YuxK